MTADLKKTILVIDDDDVLRELLDSMLNRMGYNVLQAASGDDAIKLAGKSDTVIDAAILDLFLPDIRGDKICPEMKKLHPELKIILMSGYSLENTEVFNIEIDGFFQKPGSYYDLESVLNSALSKP